MWVAFIILFSFGGGVLADQTIIKKHDAVVVPHHASSNINKPIIAPKG